MAPSVQCPGCQNHYAVTAQLAGRKVKCKACGQIMAIPALARAPAMAGGGLEYDLAGALAMTQEQTKIPYLEPTRPPEYEHLPSAIGGGIVAMFATSILAGILIIVGKQIELGIISVIVGIICTGLGAGLFVYKLPLGGFSTLAGWVVACIIGTGVTCFVVFTAPGPPPPPRAIARTDGTSPNPTDRIEQAKAALEAITANVPSTASLEEQLAQARARQDINEMRRLVAKMAEEARKREAELKRLKAESRKQPLVRLAAWQVAADPRATQLPAALIAPEVIRFQNVSPQARANCLADEEFGSSALLYTGEYDADGTRTKMVIEQWDFTTGKRVNTFDATRVQNGLYVPSLDQTKLFCRHFELHRRNALEAYSWKTGELLETTPPEKLDLVPLAQQVLRGPEDSVVVVSLTAPLSIHTFKNFQAAPAVLTLPTDAEQTVRVVAWCQSPGGRYLVLACHTVELLAPAPHKFMVVDLAETTIVGNFAVRQFVKPQVAFSPNGQELTVWCEEEGTRQSVAFIDVPTGKVQEHDGIATLRPRSVIYTGRQLQYLRNGTHVVYEGRFIAPRTDPRKIIEVPLANTECILVCGEFFGQYRFAGNQSEFHISRIAGLPE